MNQKNPYYTPRFGEELTYKEVCLAVGADPQEAPTDSLVVIAKTEEAEKYFQSLIFMAMRTTTENSLMARMHAAYGFAGLTKNNFLIERDSMEYLYNDYSVDDFQFDEPMKPMLILIDHAAQEFAIVYKDCTVVFGSESAQLYSLKMD